MREMRLGIDVACRADHQASLADERGEFLWSGWRFRTTTVDLERLWAKIPAGAQVVVVMEPTRNAWVALAAWLQARGARVSVIPPEQSADLRDYFNKQPRRTVSTAGCWPRWRCCTPKGCARSTVSAPPSRCCERPGSGRRCIAR